MSTPHRFEYRRLRAAREYRIAVAALCALALAGLGAAHHMDAHGHHVTGMNNQVVWGIPHVFALGLILAASGALNVASLSSVFGVAAQRPLARLSALLAIVLLLGGLLILVLDLGRPDRLIVAITHYNFKSVFAWNIWLYTVFVALALAYLWALFEHRAARYVRPIGALAFAWRFILTSGSGAIFGFLVARPAFDAAILVVLFIALSLSLGGAAFLLVARALTRWHGDYLSPSAETQLAQLLGAFVAVALLLTLIFHLTNLYAAEHHGVERFILLDGGVYTALFWLAQIGLGALAPLALLFAPTLSSMFASRASSSSHTTSPSNATSSSHAPSASNATSSSSRAKSSSRASRWCASRWRVTAAAALVVLGGFAQLYVIIIAGQAFPTDLFPGKLVRSSFYDGVIASYAPSPPEWLLGFGGVALALLALLLTLRALPFLPPPASSHDRVAAHD
ncbi:MAG: NrfD/PsrC family molybdoenzyme membrane anchor subunit [bacterium]